MTTPRQAISLLRRTVVAAVLGASAAATALAPAQAATPSRLTAFSDMGICGVRTQASKAGVFSLVLMHDQVALVVGTPRRSYPDGGQVRVSVTVDDAHSYAGTAEAIDAHTLLFASLSRNVLDALMRGGRMVAVFGDATWDIDLAASADGFDGLIDCAARAGSRTVS